VVLAGLQARPQVVLISLVFFQHLEVLARLGFRMSRNTGWLYDLELDH
jgi:hypothetical protein